MTKRYYAGRIQGIIPGTRRLYPRVREFCEDNGIQTHLVEAGHRYDYAFQSEYDLNLFLVAFGTWFQKVEL